MDWKDALMLELPEAVYRDVRLRIDALEEQQAYLREACRQAMALTEQGRPGYAVLAYEALADAMQEPTPRLKREPTPAQPEQGTTER